jgi:hypothetical protein
MTQKRANAASRRRDRKRHPPYACMFFFLPGIEPANSGYPVFRGGGIERLVMTPEGTLTGFGAHLDCESTTPGDGGFGMARDHDACDASYTLHRPPNLRGLRPMHLVIIVVQEHRGHCVLRVTKTQAAVARTLKKNGRPTSQRSASVAQGMASRLRRTRGRGKG